MSDATPTSAVDAADLYQDLILEHGQRPRNYGVAEPTTHRGLGNNPLCGDKVALTLSVADGRIQDCKFEGRGCAISLASASLLTESLVGKSLEQARALAVDTLGRLDLKAAAPPPAPPADLAPAVAALAPLAGVRAFPSRVKCAALAWRALSSALDQGSLVP